MFDDDTDLIDVPYLAAAFNVDPDTARNWCRDGAVPGAFQTPGGRWRAPRKAIRAIRERGTPAAASEPAA